MNESERRLVTRLVRLFDHPGFCQRLCRHAALPALVFLAAFVASVRFGGGGAIGAGTDAASYLPGANASAWEIFANNARVLAAIVVGGTITFTLGSILVLFVNAAHFGRGVGWLAESYGPTTAVAAFAPHGLLEVAAFLVGTCVALRFTVLVIAAQLPDSASPFHRENVLELPDENDT
jgi:uncharacterized membrane protein SpoIIM required for sporulation